jgi:hypothetical protein
MPCGKDWSFRFVPEKFIDPARCLALAWEEETHLFRGDSLVLPQTNIFKLRLTQIEKADLLFYLAIATVYGSQSDKVYQEVARRVKGNHGYLQYFSTGFLAQVAGPELLASVLRELRIPRHNEMGARFLHSARYLESKCAGDPLVSFRTSGIDEFLRLHTGKGKIRGLAGKTASLLAVYYRQIDILPEGFTDYFPVDIWITRILRQVGALEGTGVVTITNLEAEVRRALYRLCVENGISVPSLNNAMWRLGASGCYKCYDKLHFNRLALCPIHECCLGIGRDAGKTRRATGGMIDFDAPLRTQPGKRQLQLPMP